MIGVAPGIAGAQDPFMLPLGEALAAWRRARGNISQIALGEAAGLGKNAVGQYERGENSPTLESLERLAKALRIAVPELLAGPDAMPPIGEESSAYHVIERDTDHPREPHYVPVPLYESIPAGGWSPDAPERTGDFHVLHHLVRDTEVVVRVRGDSMYPDFRDGDLVLVDISRTKPRSGEPIIAIFRGETTFKRFRVVHRQPVLVPDNPSFPPLEVSDLDDLQVLGIVKRIVDRDVSKAVR